jgi:hypothetical protein
MNSIIFTFFLQAMPLRATVYGFGELMCGDIGKPKPCSKGAITASGEMFDPDIASAAIPVPTDKRMIAFDVFIRGIDGECHRLRVNDKSNPRWIGKRGLDLSPRAVEIVTGSRRPTWSGKLEFCDLPNPSLGYSGNFEDKTTE